MTPEFFIGTVVIGGGGLILKIIDSNQKIKNLSKENQKLKETTVNVNVYVGQIVGSSVFPTLPEEAKTKLLSIQASTAGAGVITGT